MIAILIVVILLIIVFYQYNTIVKLKLKVEQARSTIDVYYQQRFDLIPNLVEVVKEYKKYEEKVFGNIAELRNQYNTTKDADLGLQIDDRLNQIISVVENYPELKASEQFLNLQKNLEKVESQLQAARRIYNNETTNYNIQINVIPYNIIAKICGFKDETLFKVDNNEIKNNIRI